MDKRRFLITGGSQGIGAALVAAARDGGDEVVFTGRNAELIARVSAETGAHGIRADVAITEDNARTVAECHDTHGRHRRPGEQRRVRLLRPRSASSIWTG